MRTLKFCCVLLWMVMVLDARGNEFAASSLSVDAQFVDATGRPQAAPPRVGERGFLKVVVTARDPGEGRVPIAIEFEDEVEAEPLPGFRRTTVRRPYTLDQTNVVYEIEHVFASGVPAEWLVPIAVQRGGHSTIRVRADSPREGLSARAELAVTFDERSSSRGFNLPSRERVEYHTLGGSVWNGCPTNGLHGYANYTDPNGNKQPVQRAVARLFLLPSDDDPVEQELATMETKGDGHFYFCDVGKPNGTLIVRIYADYQPEKERGYRVKKGAGTLFMTSCDQCPPPDEHETKYLGDIFPDSDKDNRGFHIFDVARQAFDKIASDDCWGFAGQCRQMQFVWTPDTYGADFIYDATKPAEDYISLAGSMADYPDAIVHEIGHALKYRLYDDQGFSEDVCADHWLAKVTSPECAFEEGFASWLPTFVFGQDDFSQEGKTWSLEKPSWKFKTSDGLKWPHGEEVEGRVAGALRDIADGVNSLDNPGLTSWDYFDVGAVRNRMFKAMKDKKPATLESFLVALYDLMGKLDEYDTDAKKEALLLELQGACFQNTIDYDFRNVLSTLVPLQFPPPFSGDPDFGPEVSHAYRFQPKLGWNLVSIQTKSTKSLGLFKDKWLSDPLGDLAGTCHNGLPKEYPDPCGELAFVAYQAIEAVPQRRYAEVRGHSTAEAMAKPYTIENSVGLSTAPGSKSFVNDGKTFRVIELTGLVNGELTSVLVEPLDHQLLSIALLPAGPEAVDSHHPDIAWSLSAEADTHPIVQFTPSAPAGKTYALVILSQTPGAIAVHLDQKPPWPFQPALGFYEGNPYADPYPEYENAVQYGGPKTKVGYERYLWSSTPNWTQAPWQSQHTLRKYVLELTGGSGTATTSRLRPTHWNMSTPEFQSKLMSTAPGSAKPLCMQIMSDAGMIRESCINPVQFPSIHPTYYFTEMSKNF